VAPGRVLADSQHVTHAVLGAMARRSPVLLAPMPDTMAQAQPGEAAHVTAHRERMKTGPAREAYRQRKALSELVHAWLTDMGLDRMPVRGLRKCACVLLLAITVLNVLQHAPIARAPPRVAVAA
jgi:Transposase DDE domain